MGRIKTLLVKRITKKLISEYGDEFSTDYSKNKSIVSKFTNISSKKIRNIVAGYATRLVKQKLNNKFQYRKLNEEDLSKYYN